MRTYIEIQILQVHTKTLVISRSLSIDDDDDDDGGGGKISTLGGKSGG